MADDTFELRTQRPVKYRESQRPRFRLRFLDGQAGIDRPGWSDRPDGGGERRLELDSVGSAAVQDFQRPSYKMGSSIGSKR